MSQETASTTPRAQAVDRAAPLFGSWVSAEDDTPATYFSVCVAGTLEGETKPSTHEGYFTGRWWQSIRWDTDKDRLLRILDVSHWCEMPPLPNDLDVMAASENPRLEKQ